MKKTLALVAILGICTTTGLATASETTTATTQEPSKWSKAGSEIKEAAHAVGDATADSSRETWDNTKEGSAKAWNATKEGSAKAWDTTKDKSHELWEQGKKKVHDASAPDAPEPEGD
jgi:hypothetical protein